MYTTVGHGSFFGLKVNVFFFLFIHFEEFITQPKTSDLYFTIRIQQSSLSVLSYMHIEQIVPFINTIVQSLNESKIAIYRRAVCKSRDPLLRSSEL